MAVTQQGLKPKAEHRRPVSGPAEVEHAGDPEDAASPADLRLNSREPDKVAVPFSLVRPVVSHRHLSDTRPMKSRRTPGSGTSRKPPVPTDSHAEIAHWIGSLMPGLQPIVRQLDQTIRETLPGLQYAIKW